MGNARIHFTSTFGKLCCGPISHGAILAPLAWADRGSGDAKGREDKEPVKDAKNPSAHDPARPSEMRELVIWRLPGGQQWEAVL